MSTIVLQYALNPTTEQEEKLKSHSGAVRFAYNWLLNEVLNNWAKVKNSETNEYLNTSSYALRNHLNAHKEEVAPWWKENSKEAFATGANNLSLALKGYYNKRTGLPKFKKRDLNHSEGVTFTTGTRRLEQGDKYITLPRLETIKLHEKATKARWLLNHGAKLTLASVKYSRTRWFVTLTFRVNEDLEQQYHLKRTKKDKKRSAIGVDLGVKNLAVFSDGTVIENPRIYEKYLKKLRRLNKRLSRRQGLDKKTGQMPSRRYERAKADVARMHAKIANIEEDNLHKLSKRLVDDYSLIGLEDLNVAGMVKNHRLSRRIAHAQFGKLRQLVAYKSAWYGSKTVLIDRFYPSTQVCSQCGARSKVKILLHVRMFECDNCGVRIDRDLNAAINIEKQAVAQSCGETLNGRGDGSTGLVSPSETPVCEAISESKILTIA